MTTFNLKAIKKEREKQLEALKSALFVKRDLSQFRFLSAKLNVMGLTDEFQANSSFFHVIPHSTRVDLTSALLVDFARYTQDIAIEQGFPKGMTPIADNLSLDKGSERTCFSRVVQFGTPSNHIFELISIDLTEKYIGSTLIENLTNAVIEPFGMTEDEVKYYRKQINELEKPLLGKILISQLG